MIALNEFNSFYELIEYFNTEKICHQYIAEKRWQGIMSCPYENCSGERSYVFKDGIRYKCESCRKIYTAKTRSIFECTKLPLKIWFIAIYHVVYDRGISSVQFAKNYNITQKTAWILFQKIRSIISIPKQEMILDGVVEIDEAYIGGKNKNRHHDKKTKFVKNNEDREFKDKSTILGMMQRGSGFVKLFIVNNRQKATITKFINQNVVKGATLMTDEWRGYNDIIFDYNRKSVNHKSGQYVNEDCHTNTLEGFWTQLKRHITGRHHWVSKKHLNKYLQESAYRYNNRFKNISSRFNQFILESSGRWLRVQSLYGINYCN